MTSEVPISLGALCERMGIELTEAAPGRVVATMPVEGNTQPYGLLHGGASAVLAETLGSIAAYLNAGPGHAPVGLDLSCTHHRALRSGSVTGVATPLSVGRTISSFSIRIADEADRLVCTARLTCLIRTLPPGNLVRTPGNTSVTQMAHSRHGFGVMLRRSRPRRRLSTGEQKGAPRVQRRFLAALGAVFVALLALVALSPAASADGETVSGQLLNRVDGNRTPVPGVTITVTGDGFQQATTSGADGKWVVPLPAQGSYTVALDVSTLPSGVELTDPSKASITTTVAPPTLNRIVIFPLGTSTTQQQSVWSQAAQLTVEGFRFGLLIALGALGLSLIYGTTGLTNFAHGEIITFGALATWTLNVGLNIPLILAALIGVFLTAIFGALQNRVLWKPLRKRGTGLIAMMIVSIGLAILLRNLFLFFYGGDKQAYGEYVGQAGIEFGPVSLTPSDLAAVVIALIALAAVVIGVQRTRLGKATRAVADNPALASSAGIDVEKVIQVVWIVGAALAGLGGILLAFTQQVSFQMGFQVLLLVFAAVTLGGLGTIWGAILGSIVVGLFLQLSTLIIPPELKNVGALLVLIVILLVRPYGLLGRRERVG